MIEQTPRIDSFEAAKQEYDGILFAGRTTLDFGRYVEYGPGEVEKEFVDLCGRWRLRVTRINNGFGGTRAFWLCPYCRRRVRYLYFNGNDFVCRECAKLSSSKNDGVMIHPPILRNPPSPPNQIGAAASTGSLAGGSNPTLKISAS